jgi:hypothetical protein
MIATAVQLGRELAARIAQRDGGTPAHVVWRVTEREALCRAITPDSVRGLGANAPPRVLPARFTGFANALALADAWVGEAAPALLRVFLAQDEARRARKRKDTASAPDVFEPVMALWKLGCFVTRITQKTLELGLPLAGALR